MIVSRATPFFALRDNPMSKCKNLVTIGTGETACLAYEYFTHDSEYEVLAFAME